MEIIPQSNLSSFVAFSSQISYECHLFIQPLHVTSIGKHGYNNLLRGAPLMDTGLIFCAIYATP
jgi:hypothetical protein